MNPFKEYDIRGVVGEELLPDDVRDIGIVYSNFLKTSAVIGFDQRISTPCFLSASLQALLQQGAAF